MKNGSAQIVPMNRGHIRVCNEIAGLSDPWKSLKENIDFPRYISRKQAYVCVVDGEAAGFIIFTPEPVFARGGYLRAIGVAPSLRRRGIGKKLLTFAEKTTACHSLNFYLCVSSFNRRAQAFYKALGYTRVGNIPGLIIPGSSEYIFWKRLRPLPQKTRGKQSIL